MIAWQDLIALAVVGLAAAFLARRGWRLFFQRVRGCGACGTCPGTAQHAEPAVKNITLLREDR